jgi:hypothetical protein
MKLIILLTLATASMSASAQFRAANSNAQSGTVTATYDTATDRCVLGGGFSVYADGTNPNTAPTGYAICRLVGAAGAGTDGFTAMAGGTYRDTTNDIDPATACRLEGTVSVTSLTGVSCGVDP